MKRMKMALVVAAVAATTMLPAAPAKAGTCQSDLPGGEAICTVYFTVGYLQCKYLGKLGCLA
jgi:hypothetical protein